MKKIFSCVLALVLIGTLLSCSSSKDEGAVAADSKKIAVVMPNATHGFLGESIKHAEAATKELAEAKGYEYQFLTSAESSEQNNQLDTLINERVDVIVLWPHNGNELRAGAQSVVDANIPLIIYDRLIEGFTPTAEIMGDNVKIGEETGHYLNDYFGESAGAPINILEFKGDNSTVPQQRSDGFYSTVNKDYVTIQKFDTGWQRAKAQEQMENFLNTQSKDKVESIKAVFTHDAEVASGVISAIQSYDGDNKIGIEIVTAVSAPKELLDQFEAVKSDLDIDQVTYTFSPAMVREAVQKGIDVLDGKEVSGLYLIETEKVDNSNEKEYRSSETYVTRYSLE